MHWMCSCLGIVCFFLLRDRLVSCLSCFMLVRGRFVSRFRAKVYSFTGPFYPFCSRFRARVGFFSVSFILQTLNICMEIRGQPWMLVFTFPLVWDGASWLHFLVHVPGQLTKQLPGSSCVHFLSPYSKKGGVVAIRTTLSLLWVGFGNSNLWITHLFVKCFYPSCHLIRSPIVYLRVKTKPKDSSLLGRNSTSDLHAQHFNTSAFDSGSNLFVQVKLKFTQ